MIPCHVCGADASTGWIKGFPPAPDSQKLALCKHHNTAENRALTRADWQKMHTAQIGTVVQVATHKAAPHTQMAIVYFNGGGMASFACISCAPTPQGTLHIDELNGTQTYIPMQHVRNYAVQPLEGYLLAGEEKNFALTEVQDVSSEDLTLSAIPDSLPAPPPPPNSCARGTPLSATLAATPPPLRIAQQTKEEEKSAPPSPAVDAHNAAPVPHSATAKYAAKPHTPSKEHTEKTMLPTSSISGYTAAPVEPVSNLPAVRSIEPVE